MTRTEKRGKFLWLFHCCLRGQRQVVIVVIMVTMLVPKTANVVVSQISTIPVGEALGHVNKFVRVQVFCEGVELLHLPIQAIDGRFA
jgi:hypothetical protein